MPHDGCGDGRGAQTRDTTIFHRRNAVCRPPQTRVPRRGLPVGLTSLRAFRSAQQREVVGIGRVRAVPLEEEEYGFLPRGTARCLRPGPRDAASDPR